MATLPHCRLRRKCIVCKVRPTKHNKIRLHKFPNDSVRFRKWIRAIYGQDEVEDLRRGSNQCICSDHFEDEDYFSSRSIGVLKKEACPHLNLPVHHGNASISTSIDLDVGDSGCHVNASISESNIDLGGDSGNYSMMSSRRKGHRCVICRRNKNDCNSLKLHRFPKDLGRCKKWIKALKLPFLKRVSHQQLNNSYLVCSDHFEDDQYLNGRLLYNSVPVKDLTFVDTGESDESSDLDSDGFFGRKREVADKDLIVSPEMSFQDEDEDWMMFGLTPGYYSDLKQLSNEVRVGPSFSSIASETCSDQEETCQRVIGHIDEKRLLTGEVSAKRISFSPEPDNEESLLQDDVDSNNSSLDSDAEACAVIDSTLEHVMNDSSLKRRSKENTIICTPEEGASSIVPNPLTASFFERQLMQAECRMQSEEVPDMYSKSTQMFALSTYSKNPEVYKFLRPIFSLPPIERLELWKQKITCKSGDWNNDVFSLLEKRVSTLSEEEKVCGIVFHVFEIDSSIHSKQKVHYNRESQGRSMENVEASDGCSEAESKSISHALVFMVKGLNKNWKYIVGYYLFNNSIEAIFIKQRLEACILKLQRIRYVVKFIVCNSDRVNESLKDFLEITAEKPYFSIGYENVYFYFDPQNLLQNTLKEFVGYDISVGDNVAKWEYVHRFFEKDSKLALNLAPKVVLKNIFNEELEKNQSNVAAQVFSHEVAAGIYMHSTSGGLPKEAIHTAEFVYTLSRLLDCFKNSKLHHRRLKIGGSIKSFLDMEFLNDVESIVKTWKVMLRPKKKRGRGPVLEDSVCRSDWLININALKQMWSELHCKRKFKCFFIRRISQSCFDDIVSTIQKQHENHSVNLVDFEMAIRRIICKSFQQTSHIENFESYASRILHSSTN